MKRNNLSDPCWFDFYKEEPQDEGGTFSVEDEKDVLSIYKETWNKNQDIFK